jgi:methylated-DNA-[protein]-cysteine S-methyltransferase
MPLLVATLQTPIGPIEVVTKGGILCGITFEGHGASTRAWMEKRFGEIGIEQHASLGEVTDRIAAYFAGDVAAVEALPVDTGGTTFQTRVWEALRKITPGTTASYGEVAKMIWREKAARPVGMATGRNPIPIVIPCHRVVASDGTLGGFGGGIQRKRWLLAHEQGQRSILG